MEDCGKLIKAAREKAGLTQEALGKAIGVSGVAVMRYEKGQRQPSLAQLAKIAKTLGVSTMELLNLTPEYDTPENRAIVEAGVNAAVETMAAFEQDKKLQLEILFDRLNQTGKAEAVKRVGELTQIPKYTEPDKKAPSEEQDAPPGGAK